MNVSHANLFRHPLVHQAWSRRSAAGQYVGFHALTRLTSVARVLFIARVITPYDLGTAALILGGVSLLTGLTRPGLNTALVQRNGDVRPYLNALWTLHVLRGLAISIAALALGFPAIWILGVEGNAKLYLMLAALTPLVAGAANMPAMVLVAREMQFQRRARMETLATLADFAVLAATLLIFNDARAIVLAYLANNLVHTLASYTIHTYRPGLDFHLGKLREVYRFGRWIGAREAVSNIGPRLDSFVLAKVLDASAVGIYSMAQSAAIAPLRHIGGPLHGFLMPALSRMDAGGKRRLSLAVFCVLALFGAGFSMLAWMLGDEIVRLTLGDRWLAAVPVFGVLAVAMSLRLFDRLFLSLYEASGRPQRGVVAGLVFSGVFLALMVPMTVLWGATGTAWAIAAAAATTLGYHVAVGLIIGFKGP